ncbi:restriction endonuclease subunit S, partial [Helicobacter pylori]
NVSGFASVDMTAFKKYKFPIPPLEIQQEIVKILDQFSLLTTDLLAGIPAEIEARKKQYEYYREKLLTFKPLQNKAYFTFNHRFISRYPR